jgi:hypothetical protein
MLIFVVLEMPILLLLLLLLLFILIPDLLLQDNAIHTGLEQGAYSRSLALKETKTIEWHGGGGAGEVGEFIGELWARHWSVTSITSIHSSYNFKWDIACIISPGRDCPRKIRSRPVRSSPTYLVDIPQQSSVFFQHFLLQI